MAPSSSSLTGSQRRRAQKKQQLSRSNSSLLNTLKSLVTAPLSWFAGNEEFEDSKGKRRRLASPLEPVSDDEDKASRPKRMRIDSSPTDLGHPRQGAYLDPPAHAFKPQRASSVQSVPRSLSLSIPSFTLQELSLNSTTSAANNVRSTLSPLRNLGIARTMSVDPPTRALRREPAMANIPLKREASFESAKNPRRSATQRELSAPLMPQSSRTSFHLRSSVTPQPLVPHAQRESSEPPALSKLVINPVFVRAPSSQPADSRQRSGISQTVTLGSLVDHSRGARSPVRQHSSLLPSVPPPSDIQSQHQELAAEKALHELDIYKTPLLPSRLRLSNEASSEQATSSNVPDLFKPRRSSKLVLMHDEKRSTRIGAKHVDSRKAPLTNDTKPYAGEGGMKKLLARHKYEIGTDEEQDQRVQDTVEGDDKAMDDGQADPSVKSGRGIDSSVTKTDWFAAASDVDRPLNSASSLRVGRDKKRNHIVRPKAKSVKPKFSAAFDEDGDDMMDEGIDDEQEKIGKEEILSSKFVFSPPPGFSFAQNPQSLPESNDAKELPIPSLPFSLTKSQNGETEFPKPSPPFSFIPTRDETTISQANSFHVETVDAKSMDISSGVPNFFASSKAFSNSLDIPVAPLNFKLSPPQPIEEHAPTMFPRVASTDAGHLPTETETKREFKASIATNDSASAFVSTARETALSTTNMSPSSTLLLPPATTGFTIKTVSAAERATPLNQEQPDEAMQTTQISAAEPKRTIETTDSMNPGATHPSNESNAASVSSIVKGSGPDKPGLNLPTAASITTNDLALGGQDFASDIASKASSLPVSIEPVLPAPSFAPSTASGKLRSPPFNLTNESTAPKPSFGGFNFQITGVTDKVKSQAPVGSDISSNTPSVAQLDQKKETIGFTFPPQTSASASTSLFAFGGGGSVASDVSKPFSFGSSAGNSLGRPVTPPKAQDQEVQMDESPTRDIQSSNVKPTMSGFSFGQTPTSSSLFGTQTSGNTPSSSPFNFGPSQSLASNPFATSAKEVKPVPKKTIDFSQTSSFSFGQNNKAPDVAGTVQSPTSAPFSYGSNTNTFGFGPSSASNNPFGQPQTGSAPSSPAAFSASPFSFGTSAPNPAFMFGSSQPASPVGGTNLSLPQPSTSSFGNSGFGQSAPSSPFSTTSPLAPSAPSAPLFTIGAAPMAAPGAPRQIKKLPSRRSGPKR